MSDPSRAEIWNMFDLISSSYDKTNRWMTLGFDLYWRRKVADFLPKQEFTLLDCATGTADQILTLMQKKAKIHHAIGIDLSEEMLKIGQAKIEKTPFADRITLQKASALSLPFPRDSFDCVTMSFGIRNVTDVPLCLQEILRVLKAEGRVILLETSLPQNRLLKAFHLFYLRHLLPRIGGWISRKASAYSYLKQTAETFPHGDAFCQLLQQAGFQSIQQIPLTFGCVSLYLASKKHHAST